jgi:hypothetical protein
MLTSLKYLFEFDLYLPSNRGMIKRFKYHYEAHHMYVCALISVYAMCKKKLLKPQAACGTIHLMN